jgi:hypothetical protein
MKRTLSLQKTGSLDDKRKILTRLQNTMEELEKLDENPYLFGYLLGVNPDMLLDIWMSDEKVKRRINDRSGATINILKTITYLKKLKSGVGAAQPSSSVKGVDPFNFASMIAVLYVLAFKQKPKKTKNGIFYNIILICYKAVGLRDKNQDEEKADVYNHVKAAVDGLRWSYPKFSNR